MVVLTEHGPGCDCRDRFASGDELVADAQEERTRIRRQVVAELLALGMTTRQVGAHLGVSAMAVSRLSRMRLEAK